MTARRVAVKVAVKWEPDSTLVISVSSFEDTTVYRQLRDIRPVVRVAPRVVFDLRRVARDDSMAPGPSGFWEYVGVAADAFYDSGINELLVTRPLRTPGWRRRTWVAEDRQADLLAYQSGFYTALGEVLFILSHSK